MQDVTNLLKGTTEELDKLLNARNVLGDPIEREGVTVIPIVSFGFGFGAGGGSGQKAETGGGTGAGGGIKPVGAIIFDSKGARVESVKGPVSNLAQVVGDVAERVMTKTGKGGEETPAKPDERQ